MVIKPNEISVGCFYVSEGMGLVREITGENETGDVFWRSYNLLDGGATGDSLVCSKAHLARWADREASADEVSRLDRREAARKAQAREQIIVDAVLDAVSDECLLNETRRRGLDVRE